MAIVDVFQFIFEADAKKLEDGLERADRDTKKLDKSLADTDRTAGKLGASFLDLARSAAVGVAALVSYSVVSAVVRDVAAATDAIGKQATALGVSVTALDAWDSAVAKAGGSAGTFTATLGAFNERVQDFAVKGSAELGQLFAKVGLTLDEVKAKASDPIALLADMSDQLRELSSAEAVGLGKKLGIDAATIGILREGRAGVDGLIAAELELGAITQEQFEVTAKYNDAMADMQRVFDDVRRRIVVWVIPALTWMSERFTALGKVVRENSTLVVTSLLLVSGVLLGAVLPSLIATATAAWALIAPFLPIGLAIAAVVAVLALLVDDLWNFQKGNDSVIGELAKKWPWIGALIKQVGNQIAWTMAAVVGAMEAVFALFRGGPEAAIESLRQSFGFLASDIEAHIPALAGLGDLVTRALDGAGTALGFLRDVFSDVFAVITGRADLVSETLGGMAVPLRAMAEIVGVFGELFGAVAGTVVTWIREGIVAAFEYLFSTADRVFNFLSRGFPAISAAVRSMGGVMQTVIGFITRLWDALIASMTLTLERIKSVGNVLTAGARLIGLAPSPAATEGRVTPRQRAAGVPAAPRTRAPDPTLPARQGLAAGQAQLTAAAASPVGASSSSAITNSLTRNSSRTTTVQVGDVNVQTQATDADGIASSIGQSLQQQFTSAIDQFDDGVAA